MTRRTLRELMARYRLEPTLREAFVEGSHDASILQWVLSDSARNLAITPVEVVDVPYELLAQYGLSDGNRGRVLALGLELDKHGQAGLARCVADRDFLFLLEVESPRAETIIYTDYACIDVYVLESSSLNKFLQLGLGVQESGDHLLAAISDALIKLSCVRAALHELGDGSAVINNVGRCFRGEGDRVVLDVDDLIGRSVRSRASVPAVRNRAGELEGLVYDSRDAIRAGDLAEILFWRYRSALRRRGIRSSPGVRALLAPCLDATVRDQPLFVALRDFAHS